MIFDEADLRALYCEELSSLAAITSGITRTVTSVRVRFVNDTTLIYDVASTQPFIEWVTADLANVAVGDPVAVEGGSYTVAAKDPPTGDGVTRCRLMAT